MKISRDWLSDFVALDGVSDAEIAARLTEIGHAVESTEQHGSDTVFEIEFTSNRVDAMSHRGLARELAAALARPLRRFDHETGPIAGFSSDIDIRIEAPDLCSRFSGMVIRGVTLKPSSEKIQRRLEAVGLRPINNVVDATNYVMLALGHPLHAYDLTTIGERKIIVRRGARGESMRTLDGEMRKVDSDTVVIADGTKAIGLGGIMGGENSEISDSTRDVLLECAHFDPPTVRRTARRLGMKTDASYRFERGVDPNNTLDVIAMTRDMILAGGGGEPRELLDVVGRRIEPITVRLADDRIVEMSGGMIAPAYALDLLPRLGMECEREGNSTNVTIPTWRGDIQEETDLLEELLRIFGYNNIPPALPRVTTGDVHEDKTGEAEDSIRDVLASCGLTEVVTYSFIHAGHNRIFSDEKPLEISNALTENLASMRLSILPGLLGIVAFNRSYGIREGALFEVGRTYHSENGKPRERHVATIAMYGNIGSGWSDEKRAIDFLDVKGVVEVVARKFHVDVDFSPNDIGWMKSGHSGKITARSGEVGFAGFLSPEVLRQFDIKGDVAVAQIDVDVLLAAVKPWTMAPVSKFPGIPMVVAMMHSPDLEYATIVEKIRTLDVPHLQEIGIWDRFVPEGGSEPQVKTALGLWYQAFDHSLTQEEVSEIQKRLNAQIAELLPVKLIG